MTSWPMTCIACRADRHDLCSAPANLFCECPDETHPSRVIHAGDITIPAVDKQGRAIACAPTREQYLAASVMTDHIHFVRNQEHTGGGE